MAAAKENPDRFVAVDEPLIIDDDLGRIADVIPLRGLLHLSALRTGGILSISGMKRHAAPGVDDETWQSYCEGLEANLLDLSGRLQRGAYRAKPVKRSYIPKVDGSQRPIGIPRTFLSS